MMLTVINHENSSYHVTMLAPIHSSMLFLSRNPLPIEDMDIETASDFESALELVKQFHFKTFIADDTFTDDYERFTDFLKKIKTYNDQIQTLLIHQSLPTENLLNLVNSQSVDFISTSEDNDEQLLQLIHRSIESYDQKQQQRQLLQLFDDQNERLKSLKKNLEERVDRRQKFLQRSEKKLAKANQQIELLHASLLAVHRAKSMREMEALLFETLKPSLHLDWIRISFAAQSNIGDLPLQEANFRVVALPIKMKENAFGDIRFARDIRRPYKLEEEELLVQISEAVSLAISRLVALEESEELKAQWETTFDAFSEPLCLIDNENRIMRSNHAMVEVTGRPYKDLIGMNPFEMVLNEFSEQFKNLPIPFRKRFELSEDSTVFEVLCQQLANNPNENLRIVIFRDVTEESRLEKHALESSKMAELGIIGSSIAHELNNPLGGMINFLQLMKMDLQKEDSLYTDVSEMESAAKKCKEIIESLLGFARKRSPDAEEQFDLNDVIHHSLKLVEIQTKSKGIHVDWQPLTESLVLKGNQNQMVQAIRNILQNSIEAIESRRQKTPNLIGQIEVEVSVREKVVSIQIHDNGDGIPSQALHKIFNPLFSLKKSGLATGLGLTVAFKIISDNNGHLEISSQQGAGTTARISMESPELLGSSQVFDSKI